MEKNCINCGKTIPDESMFCLYCFTEQEAASDAAPLLYGVAAPPKPLNKKKLAGIFALAFMFIITMGCCISAMKRQNSAPELAPEVPVTETQIVTYTQTVAVTDASGEQVTDNSGEAVTNIITVTQVQTYSPAPVTTTEKQGFFDKLFDKKDETTKENNTAAGDSPASTQSNNSGNSSTVPQTTEKQSFFDIIFGKNEETTTPATTQKTTAVTQSVATTGTPSNTTAGSTATTTKTTTTTKTSTTTTTQKPTTTTTTQPTTTAAPTTQPTTEQSSYYFEYAPYNENNPDGAIQLTKYVGNASVIHIPTHINGKKVYAIGKNCFVDNYQLREIYVDYSSKRDYFYISSFAFDNCPNLTKIDCTEEMGVHFAPWFSKGCPITELIFKGHEEKFIDGALYSNGLLWYTCHPDYTTLTLPPQCKTINNGHNLYAVPNLKILNIHKNVSNIPYLYTHYNDGLEQVNVEPGNPRAISVNGIMFCRYSTSNQFDNCIYPRQNKTKTLVMPRADLVCTLGFNRSSSTIANENLEELWLNEKSLIHSPDAKWMYTTAYPNLKRIYITPNHPQYEDIAKTFTGELIVKDF